ncbi:MAG: hypothetical protein ACK5OX_02105 [Desertimonas sp.]
MPLTETPEESVRLRRERDEAWAHARALEHQLGEARGQIKRLELVLYRRTQRRQVARAYLVRARELARRARR